jgi:hypothetical protein
VPHRFYDIILVEKLGIFEQTFREIENSQHGHRSFSMDA